MQIYDWKSCESVSSVEEYEAMDRIVSAHCQNFGRDLFCLEVGSYRGQSTILLAQYGVVFCIDLWADIHDGMAKVERAGQDSFLEFMETMKRFGLIAGQRIFPIVGTTAGLNYLAPSQFDVIYIDGSHYYEPAKLDIQASERHLAEDGLYIFHDYKRVGDNPHLGVNQAVDELLEDGDYEIQEHFRGLVCLKHKTGMNGIVI